MKVSVGERGVYVDACKKGFNALFAIISIMSDKRPIQKIFNMISA